MEHSACINEFAGQEDETEEVSLPIKFIIYVQDWRVVSKTFQLYLGFQSKPHKGELILSSILHLPRRHLVMISLRLMVRTSCNINHTSLAIYSVHTLLKRPFFSTGSLFLLFCNANINYFGSFSRGQFLLNLVSFLWVSLYTHKGIFVARRRVLLGWYFYPRVDLCCE